VTAPSGFTWLKHVGTEGTPGHEGTWKCPDSAVETWLAMGWEPCDPPEEPNLVVAENLAAQKVAAEERARLDKEAAAGKRVGRRAAKAEHDAGAEADTSTTTDTPEGN
jgi:hypothetical protein